MVVLPIQLRAVNPKLRRSHSPAVSVVYNDADCLHRRLGADEGGTTGAATSTAIIFWAADAMRWEERSDAGAGGRGWLGCRTWNVSYWSRNCLVPVASLMVDLMALQETNVTAYYIENVRRGDGYAFHPGHR